jgi:CRP-like cAMP-binding protein
MCAAAGTALAKNTLLGTLEDQEMTTLVEFAFPYQAEAGATIIQQGDVGDYFYIIKNGKVEYVKDGKKEPFQGGKTDSFGELALLHDDKRAATVVARTDCDLFRISRDSFRYAIANAQNQESASYLDSLRKVKLFENLSDSQLDQLSRVCMACDFKEGQKVFKKGQPGSIFYLIQVGKVVVSDIGANFKDVNLGAGDYFGEKALSTGDPRNATATAGVGGCTLIELEREDFEKILGPLEQAISMTQHLRILSSLELFSNLSDHEKNEVIQKFGEKDFKKGQTILDEAKADPTFYIIKEGKVRMSTHEAGDKEISLLAPGDSFNLAALQPTQEGLVWPTCVAASKKVVCFVLERKDLVKITGAGFKDIASKAYGARQAELNSAKEVKIPREQLTQVAQLGQGTFGRVSLVQDTQSKRVFALKALHKKEIVEYKQQANVMNEKNIMLMCHHPFILALHNTYRDEYKLYMLLEYCNGGELFGRLHTSTRDGLTKPEHAMFYTGCCALALGYMLQRKIIYRDLKPENMLIDKEGYVKVIDFGFAKVADGKCFTLCGTPEYMAPEIILGRGYDISVDWWALGILIYECLSGESPFSANDQNAICRKIVQRSFKYPKTAMFTPDAKDIIDKLLQKKGSDRLASGPSGASAVKNHPFYKSIDWNGLMAKTEKAPWVPKVKNDLDVSNFDSYGVDDTFDKSWSDPAPGWDRDF